MKRQPVIAFKYLPMTIGHVLRLVWMAEVSRRVFAIPSWGVGVMYTVVVILSVGILTNIALSKPLKPVLVEDSTHA